MLKSAQRDAIQQIADAIALLRRQADSTYDGRPWTAVSLPLLGNRLITFGQSLVRLDEQFNSGKPPQWVTDQQTAYDASALGRLQKRKRD